LVKSALPVDIAQTALLFTLKEGRLINRQPQFNLYRFYCLLHVSALVKSTNPGIKNTRRKIFKNPIKIILLQAAKVSALQKLELYKPKLDKCQDCI
jgi:hypothetical protein